MFLLIDIMYDKNTLSLHLRYFMVHDDQRVVLVVTPTRLILKGVLFGVVLRLLLVNVVQTLRFDHAVEEEPGTSSHDLLGSVVACRRAVLLAVLVVGFHCLVRGGSSDQLMRELGLVGGVIDLLVSFFGVVMVVAHDDDVVGIDEVGWRSDSGGFEGYLYVANCILLRMTSLAQSTMNISVFWGDS